VNVALLHSTRAGSGSSDAVDMTAELPVRRAPLRAQEAATVAIPSRATTRMRVICLDTFPVRHAARSAERGVPVPVAAGRIHPAGSYLRCVR
jgi:hypothetical protein